MCREMWGGAAAAGAQQSAVENMWHGRGHSLHYGSVERKTEHGRITAMLGLLADALTPPRCPLCDMQLAGDAGLCGVCWNSLTFITPPLCVRTGVPMPVDLGDETISLAARIRPPRYHRARAGLAYEGNGRRLITRLKFGDRPEIARTLAVFMQRAGAEILGEADCLVPVPLHRLRLIGRRFNQAAELCRALSRATGLPVELKALSRIRHTRHQLGLTRAQRRRNVRGAFSLPDAARLEGRRVVLVDDVLTTGATVNACAETLLKAGVAQVDVLTAARVVLPEIVRV